MCFSNSFKLFLNFFELKAKLQLFHSYPSIFENQDKGITEHFVPKRKVQVITNKSWRQQTVTEEFAKQFYIAQERLL